MPLKSHSVLLLPRSLAATLLAASLLLLGQSSCGTDAPNGILLELSPEVISSQEATLHVRALVVTDRAPTEGSQVRLSTTYIDRNGDERAIDPVTGTTDVNGVFEAVLSGFVWDGSGTVSAELVSGDGVQLVDDLGEPIATTATFSVLDRTPPSVTILPPTVDLRVGAGFPLDVQVEVQDEIGISEVILEAAGELDRLRSTVVASGAASAVVDFEMNVPNDARPGPTITLYALAVDLSGNIAAAEPVVLTVDPAIAIAVTEGLDGAMLSEGDDLFLSDPRALAMSPRDGMLYVADNSNNNPCNGGCIRQVDPATGNPTGGVVVLAAGVIEGIAFDATGDNLYYSDRQDRVYRLSYNAGNQQYENRTACNDIANQDPQDPMHLVFDAVRGILVVDRQDQRVKQLNACDGSQPQRYNNQDFPDRPWGIAVGPGGELYVSDDGVDRIYMVNGNGDNVFFEDRSLDQPRGIVWLGDGGTSFANSLLVANNGDRRILSTTGPESARTAVYLRNDPVDVEVDNNVLYILTQRSAGDPGRIFVVTGF